MNDIAILAHEHDAFEDRPYLLREIIRIWRKQGLKVSILNGLEQQPKADLAILHVDLTRVPADYLAAIQPYPLTLNGRVQDISKSFLGRNQVQPGDAYEGQVIVKTDLNAGGNSERLLAKKTAPWKWRFSRLFANRIGADYPIFRSPSQVPKRYWKDPSLVVERFLPEIQGDFYCLRTWVFLGDRETHSLSYALEPRVKGHNVVRREVLGGVPEELRALRKDLGFDFGKFDYALLDGKVVLYDINRTPALGFQMSPELQARIDWLAAGIEAYV